jgi:pantetheine-phosphate adenylyltransferase
MAHNNHALTGVRTVYVPCRPDLGYISSRFVREIAAHGGLGRASRDRTGGGGARR